MTRQHDEDDTFPLIHGHAVAWDDAVILGEMFTQPNEDDTITLAFYDVVILHEFAVECGERTSEEQERLIAIGAQLDAMRNKSYERRTGTPATAKFFTSHSETAARESWTSGQCSRCDRPSGDPTSLKAGMCPDCYATTPKEMP